MFPALPFIFILICINCVICEKISCDLEDTKCLTGRSNLILREFTLGKPFVEASDPLHRDLIEVNLPKIMIKLTNASLSGMIKCHLKLVKIIKKDLKYEVHLRCPYLILESEYEMKSELVSVYLEGEGTCRVDYRDYNFYFTGNYEKKNKNGKEHIYFRNTNLDIELENTHYEFKNLFNGDKKKSGAAHKALNKRSKMVDKSAQLLVIKPFMDKYLDNVNDYTDIVPLEALFSLP